MTAQDTNKSRTLVNILGIPSLILIIWNGGVLFSIFVCIVMCIGAIELCNLAKVHKSEPSLVLLLIGLLGICASYACDHYYSYQLHWIIVVALFSMILEVFRNKPKPLLNISTIIFGIIWLGVMLGSMIKLRNINEYGRLIVLVMFLSVWLCDTFAFFFGTKFGKKKILPSVSPKKSWVGSIAGLLGSIIFMIILHYNNIITPGLTICDSIVLGVIFGGFSQLGDFFESLLKREAGIKDTSNFLMGHGGILDRFDSLSFAAPLTYLYIIFIGLLNG